MFERERAIFDIVRHGNAVLLLSGGLQAVSAKAFQSCKAGPRALGASVPPMLKSPSSVMKRKPSDGSLGAAICKPRKRLKATTGCKDRPCYLLDVLAQYGLLTAIIANLLPRDLYALAATSKTAYRTIFAGHESHASLLGKMVCDSRGVKIRTSYHHILPHLQPPNTSVRTPRCGANDSTITTHPCATCNHMTCDECRIHCVFQTTYSAPDADDELPNLGGFALLSKHEMGILSPFHLGLEHCPTREQAENIGLATSYHDKGYLEPPLVSDVYAHPESIADIINFDLQKPLQLSTSSTAVHPSSVIQPFWEITEARKRWLCHQCRRAWRARSSIEDERYPCHCTLKQRFLDRWLCLSCYQAEVKETANAIIRPKDGDSICNSCGILALRKNCTRVCAWCLGECTELPPR